MTKPNQIIGSVSSGTMREQDLIPAFLDALEQLNPEQAASIREEHQAIIAKVGVDDLTIDDLDEQSCFLNETLFDALLDCAPPYFYFGSHPGDGADYGFWLSEEALENFDGLKVSDTNEVPADYSREVLHVNDHGNPTLYTADKGELTEVWALV